MTWCLIYHRNMGSTINKEELKSGIEGMSGFVLKKANKPASECEKERSADFDVCPKCGRTRPHLIKGGKTSGGKQIYRCKECGSRFVADCNEVTFHSRLSREQWNEAVRSTLSGDSLDKTASRCGVTHLTAFNMRRKIKAFLEKNADLTGKGEE